MENNNGTILYIEDNPDNLRLLRRVLEGNGYTFLSATNGYDGIELAKSQQVSLVIVDIHLPDIDGYEVMTQLRKMRDDLPFLVITADVIQYDQKRALEAGCNHFLTKPIRIHDLIDCVHALLQK